MLEGDLQGFTLPDILRLLALTAKSGRLSLTFGDRQGRVDLVEGRVRDASADADRLPLARRALGSGVVDGAALLEALHGEGRLPTDLELARRLASAGVSDPSTIGELVREQTVDALFDLLRWNDGAFSFTAGEAEGRGPSVLDLAIGVDEVLDEVGRRLDAWPTLAERTGDLEAVVSIRRPGRDRAEVALPPDGWTLLSLVDGRRTLGDLVALSGQGEYRTRRTLSGLLDEGVVAVGRTGGPGPVERLLDDHAKLKDREVELGGRAGEATPIPSPVAEPTPAATPAASTEPTRADAPVATRPEPQVAAPAASSTTTPPADDAVADGAEVRQLRTKVRQERLQTDPNVDEDLVNRLIEGVQGL